MPVPPTALLGGFVAIFSDSSGRLYADYLLPETFLPFFLGAGGTYFGLAEQYLFPQGFSCPHVSLQE